MAVNAEELHDTVLTIFDHLENWPGGDVDTQADDEESWADADCLDPFGVGDRTYASI